MNFVALLKALPSSCGQWSSSTTTHERLAHDYGIHGERHNWANRFLHDTNSSNWPHDRFPWDLWPIRGKPTVTWPTPLLWTQNWLDMQPYPSLGKRCIMHVIYNFYDIIFKKIKSILIYQRTQLGPLSPFGLRISTILECHVITLLKIIK